MTADLQQNELNMLWLNIVSCSLKEATPTSGLPVIALLAGSAWIRGYDGRVMIVAIRSLLLYRLLTKRLEPIKKLVCQQLSRDIELGLIVDKDWVDKFNPPDKGLVMASALREFEKTGSCKLEIEKAPPECLWMASKLFSRAFENGASIKHLHIEIGA
ncbi:MAG: hypothetical protein K2X27_21125 [Candidatus Obscuribacterales bacterium]|nr:hypothetical protein [Candidatus Obscuribacterales bacterium]